MRTFRSLLTGLGIAGLLVGTLNLAGCGATMPTATAGSQGDIATASDESEVRKRARIRMELAATYFSQGQFTTALDELKQRARELGANAIVGLDLDYEVLGKSNGMLMVSASGTAVLVE